MGKKILVIDDDAGCLEALNEVLMYFGFEVKAEEGKANVFELLKDFLPDILLIDHRLKGVSGLEWCSRIKNDPCWAQLPVIIITADVRLKENFLAAHVCDVLIPKPFDIDILVNKIHELIPLANQNFQPL